MELLMGLDIGSTNTKAVIFDEKGNVYSEGGTVTKLSTDKDNPTWTYWNPDDIWSGAKIAISKAVSALKTGDKIVALACSSFSADFVPVDINGEPLYYFKSWHCSRTVPQMEEWLKYHSKDEIFLKHGRVTEKLMSMFMMRWLSDNMPSVVEKTYKILQISDYIVYKLTGEMSSDYTQAATSGVFDPAKGIWDKEYLKWTGFDVSQMPTAVESGKYIANISPKAAQETGLSTDTKVIAGAHDNECGAFGMGLCDEKSAYNVCGTWEQVITAHKGAQFDKISCDSTAVARYVVPEHFVSIVFGLSANLLEWGKDNFYAYEKQVATENGTSVWKHILKETENIPALSNGIVVLPLGFGEADAGRFSEGAILGINNYLGRADVMHAIYEALGYQTRKFIEKSEKDNNTVYDSLVCVGGPTRNEQLIQIKADICNKEIKVTDVSEGTALGAAMIAGVGAGVYSDAYDAVKNVTSSRKYRYYTPDKTKTTLYNDAYKKFIEIKNTLKNVK